MSTAISVIVAVIAVPAVSFALALSLAKRQRGYESRSQFYAVLLSELRSRVVIARLQYPSVGEVPRSPTSDQELGTLDASIALHASQIVRLLFAEFQTAMREFYGHTMMMEGIARAREQGQHDDLEASHREEARHHHRQLDALKWVNESLGWIEAQMRRELHGSDRLTRRANRIGNAARLRIAERASPRNLLGLPDLPADPDERADSTS
jgi:hypothetical protein